MAIFKNDKQAREYLPFLNDMVFKTSQDLQFYADIMRSLVSGDWKIMLYRLVNDREWQKDKEKRAIIRKLFYALKSKRLKMFVNDSDLEYIKSCQVKDDDEQVEDIKTKVIKREDGTVVEFDYNAGTHRQRNNERQKRHQDKLRLSYHGADSISQQPR